MSGVWRHPIRFLLRLPEVLWFFIRAAGAAARRFGWRPGPDRRRARAEWLQQWCREALRVFRIQVAVKGPLPPGGLLASNHLSYVDILVLGSLQPTVFVSKEDVKRWPIFGWYARVAGTLFIKREQRGHVAEISRQFAPLIAGRLPVVMFLEGTSTGGDRVLPFRPSLLEPAVVNDWPATPVWIGYSLSEGSVADEIAYWRDMTMVPHLFNLLTKTRITAHVGFGAPLAARDHDRKELARRLHARVCELAAQFGRRVDAGGPHSRSRGSEAASG